MKKFLIFIVLIVIGYLAYDNFIKDKPVYEIKDAYNKTRGAVDLDAPAIAPTDYGYYSGKIKNLSDKDLTNIVITYLIDAKESKAEISIISPGQEVEFKTEPVMLRHMDAAHHLQDVLYYGK